MTTKKKDIKLQRELDKKPITGRFKFHEQPGGTLRFPYRMYKGDPIETYELEDEKIYTLPRGIVKHLNTEGRYIVHEYVNGSDGKPEMRIGKKIARFGFEALDFIDLDDDETPELYVAEIDTK